MNTASDEEIVESLFRRVRRIRDGTAGRIMPYGEALAMSATARGGPPPNALEPLVFYALFCRELSNLPEIGHVITKWYLLDGRGAGATLRELRSRGVRMGGRTFWRRLYGDRRRAGSRDTGLAGFWAGWAKRYAGFN